MALTLARVAALVCLVACGEHAGSASARGQDTSAAEAERAAAPAMWLARAEQYRPIASWLYLRAAAVIPDSAARIGLYARVSIPVAHDRIPWVEAQARERFGDTLGALRAYTELGASVQLFRLRGALASTAADREALRRDLVAFVAAAANPESVRAGFTLFDKLYPLAEAADQLLIARAAAATGAWARARAGFERAGPVDALSPHDRFMYASSLAHANQDSRAAAVYLNISSPTSLASAARYQGARALLASGNASRARSLLQSLGQDSDSSAAGALSLLADLASDDGDDARSRSLLLQVVSRFPSSRFAPAARFNAALIALILGQPARTVDELARIPAAAQEALGAAYWRGRAQHALGQSAAARATWRAVINRDSVSYYAMLAAARLGTHNISPSRAARGYPRVPAVDSAAIRIDMLRQLGMHPELQLEADRLFREAQSDSARLLATAAVFGGTDQSSKGIALGRHAIAEGGPSPEILRLIFPLAVRDTILQAARTVALDPALVAAVIRQESNFNPIAVSPAGARGLMQLMPQVARSIASSAGIAPWSASMLFDPGINVTLGVRHLAPLVLSQPDLPRALAAYNAGQSRVARWARKRGAQDPEMFTERIPFAETRDYVKVVLRNREVYRALYTW